MVVAWFFFFLILACVVGVRGPLHSTWPESPLVLAVVVLWSVLLVISAFSFLALAFGMAIYCVVFDPSPAIGKVFWFILFFFAWPFGSAIYYFAVYRKPTPIRPEVLNA
jgi:hypothetical protein